MEETTCNHTSIGLLIKRGDHYLLSRRVKFPYGYAPPAGHVSELLKGYVPPEDQNNAYEAAARRELLEETGLVAQEITLRFSCTTYNPCSRKEGDWHHWRVYQATIDDDAQPRETPGENEGMRWIDLYELECMARRTLAYQRGQISEGEWRSNPGLEPVWVTIFENLGIIAPTPTIVCLCGSTKFMDTVYQGRRRNLWDEANLRETMAGRIVLSVGCNFKDDDLLAAGTITEADKERLDELHLRKIDLADQVYFINPGGYLGSSSRRELEYALAQGKLIRSLEPITVGRMA